MGQTVGIAGHRTTYLAPFRFINELHRGDRIYVTMPYGKFTYVVQKQQIVQPTDVWVVNNVGYDRLVLSACNPIYSASQRIIVFAKLTLGDAAGASARGRVARCRAGASARLPTAATHPKSVQSPQTGHPSSRRPGLPNPPMLPKTV